MSEIHAKNLCFIFDSIIDEELVAQNTKNIMFSKSRVIGTEKLFFFETNKGIPLIFSLNIKEVRQNKYKISFNFQTVIDKRNIRYESLKSKHFKDIVSLLLFFNKKIEEIEKTMLENKTVRLFTLFEKVEFKVINHTLDWIEKNS